MSAEENLAQKKAIFDEAITAFLARWKASQDIISDRLFSREEMARLMRVMRAYREALLEAAKSAPQEVGEDYIKEANLLPENVGFLTRVLSKSSD